MGLLNVLRKPHLACLWISQVLSAMGNYLYEMAVMWVATKTAGGSAGLIIAAETTSMLVFGLFGGVYADRLNRQRVMVLVDLLRAGTVAILSLLASIGMVQIWHFVLVAIIIGALGALFDPALQASLPVLTADTRTLQAMNGLMDVTRRVARILGPGMAGILLAVMPLFHFFTLDALSFVASALAVLLIGRHFLPDTPGKHPGHQVRAGVLREIGDGARLAWGQRPVAWALVMNGLMNIAWSAGFIVGVPLLAGRVLAGTVATYGLIVGAYGVGNVLSTVVVSHLTIRRRVPFLFLGKIVGGAGFLLLGSATTIPQALLGSALAAVGGPMEDLMLLLLIQTEFPATHTGKIYSFRLVVASIGASLGFFLAVPAIAHLGVSLTILLAAVIFLTTGLAGLVRFGIQ
jgi:MFS family permease